MPEFKCEIILSFEFRTSLGTCTSVWLWLHLSIFIQQRITGEGCNYTERTYDRYLNMVDSHLHGYLSNARRIINVTFYNATSRKYRGIFEEHSPENYDHFGKDWSQQVENMQVPKGRDQVTGGVSVPCRHATSVANVLWKPLKIRLKIELGTKSDQ